MKFIIAGFPLFTITAAQHLGAALPTLPICIIAGLSSFSLALLIMLGIQRIINARIRLRTAGQHKDHQFLHRWDAVRRKIWEKFYHMPPSEESLRRLKRNHNRLLRVICNRTKQKSESSNPFAP